MKKVGSKHYISGGRSAQRYRRLFRVSSNVSEGDTEHEKWPRPASRLGDINPAGLENVRQVGPCMKPDDNAMSQFNWCNVEWNGNVGWVSISGLETSQEQPRLAVSTPFGKNATSLWIHNGSIMRLSARGPARIIAYEQPRSGMQQVGVRKGDVLFEGTRDGSAPKGLARVFTSTCGVWKYEVAGARR